MFALTRQSLGNWCEIRPRIHIHLRDLNARALLQLCQTLQAFRDPNFIELIECINSAVVRGQDNPRLFRTRVDMHIGRHQVWIIERAHANEPDMLAKAAHVVIAPNRDFAFGAACNVLASAAWRRNRNSLDFSRKQRDAIGLIQGIDSERRTGVFLTATAMTAMYDHRLCNNLISQFTTCAATFGGFRSYVHGGLFSHFVLPNCHTLQADFLSLCSLGSHRPCFMTTASARARSPNCNLVKSDQASSFQTIVTSSVAGVSARQPSATGEWITA